MSYKAGDKFEISIGEVLKSDNLGNIYRIAGFHSLVFDDYGLDQLRQIQPDKPKCPVEVGDMAYFNTLDEQILGIVTGIELDAHPESSKIGAMWWVQGITKDGSTIGSYEVRKVKETAYKSMIEIMQKGIAKQEKKELKQAQKDMEEVEQRILAAYDKQMLGEEP